jgi:hypothetical protein
LLDRLQSGLQPDDYDELAGIIDLAPASCSWTRTRSRCADRWDSSRQFIDCIVAGMQT